MALYKDGSFAILNIALEKEGEKSHYNTGYSYSVTYPSINPLEQGLILLSGQHVLLSLWYSDSTLNTFFLVSKMRKGVKKKKVSDTAWQGKYRAKY